MNVFVKSVPVLVALCFIFMVSMAVSSDTPDWAPEREQRDDPYATGTLQYWRGLNTAKAKFERESETVLRRKYATMLPGFA